MKPKSFTRFFGLQTIRFELTEICTKNDYEYIDDQNEGLLTILMYVQRQNCLAVISLTLTRSFLFKLGRSRPKTLLSAYAITHST